MVDDKLITRHSPNFMSIKNKKKISDTILATDSNGNDLTIRQVNDWIRESNSKQLAEFFWHRTYGRFLKPFDFDNEVYKKQYKSGFAIMTSCCLLIETFVSFTEPVFKKTGGKSERCFGYFFLTNPAFSAFANGGLTVDEYKNLSIKMKDHNKGIPQEFYKNVRCGLLHNGETRKRWKIRRDISCLLDIDKTTNIKTIDAFIFMNELKTVIKSFKKDLLNSDYETADIWQTYKNRLNLTINYSQ